MSRLFQKLLYPSSERTYYLRPFLLVVFSLILLLLAEFVKGQKEIQINVPDKIAVKSDSNVTYNQDQFNQLLIALEGLSSKQQNIIVKTELPKQQVSNSKRKKHRKRWRPAGYY